MVYKYFSLWLSLSLLSCFCLTIFQWCDLGSVISFAGLKAVPAVSGWTHALYGGLLQPCTLCVDVYAVLLTFPIPVGQKFYADGDCTVVNSRLQSNSMTLQDLACLK